jgi:hypothetical protein
MQIEFGVMQALVDSLHRGPWPREEASRWVNETEEMGFPKGFFYLVSREVGEWKPVTED